MVLVDGFLEEKEIKNKITVGLLRHSAACLHLVSSF